MRVVILYQPRSEHARKVEEFIHDFTHDHPDRRLEVIDVDTQEGSHLAQLYEVMAYPAVLALDNDGRMLQSWVGQFPLLNELSYYTVTA